MSDEPDQKKIVNLADARQRQRTTAKAGRAGAKAKPGKPQPPAKPRLWSYVQLVFFLAIVTYLMRLCRMG